MIPHKSLFKFKNLGALLSVYKGKRVTKRSSRNNQLLANAYLIKAQLGLRPNAVHPRLRSGMDKLRTEVQNEGSQTNTSTGSKRVVRLVDLHPLVCLTELAAPVLAE